MTIFFQICVLLTVELLLHRLGVSSKRIQDVEAFNFKLFLYRPVESQGIYILYMYINHVSAHDVVSLWGFGGIDCIHNYMSYMYFTISYD